MEAARASGAEGASARLHAGGSRHPELLRGSRAARGRAAEAASAAHGRECGLDAPSAEGARQSTLTSGDRGAGPVGAPRTARGSTGPRSLSLLRAHGGDPSRADLALRRRSQRDGARADPTARQQALASLARARLGLVRIGADGRDVAHLVPAGGRGLVVEVQARSRVDRSSGARSCAGGERSRSPAGARPAAGYNAVRRAVNARWLGAARCRCCRRLHSGR